MLTGSFFDSHRTVMDGDDPSKAQDPTAKVPEQWSLTPSLLDPESYAFSTLASQSPAYYNTTPTAIGLPNQRQPTDIPTPNMAMNMLTPHLIPNNTGSIDPASISNPAMDMAVQQPYVSHMGHGADPFGQQSFHPGSLMHRNSDLSTLEQSTDESAYGGMSLNGASLGLVNNHHGLGDSVDAYNGYSNDE